MFVCPKCNDRLCRQRSPRGVFWTCGTCSGRALTLPLLRRTLARDYVNQIWESARKEQGVRRRPCPACAAPMIDVPIVHSGTSQWLDVCTRCNLVWFDPHEYEEAPAQAPPPAEADESLPPKARELLALRKVRQIAEEARNEAGPDEAWKQIPVVLDLPVEESNPLQGVPWMTWGLVGFVTLVSVWAFFGLHRAVQDWGLVPNEALRCGGLTLITSFFLHVGVLHLVPNMYFLWVFGDNVEDVLGKRRYALLLLLATVCGNLLHIVADPRSSTPCIGASGGISGVLVFYVLTFPHARLGFYWVRRYWGVWTRSGWTWMPAWAWFTLWVALQILGAFKQVGGLSGVSSLAHLGGAVAGAAFWGWTKLSEGAGREAVN